MIKLFTDVRRYIIAIVVAIGLDIIVLMLPGEHNFFATTVVPIYLVSSYIFIIVMAILLSVRGWRKWIGVTIFFILLAVVMLCLMTYGLLLSDVTWGAS